jgi:short-subunit dehydrogenase
MLAKVLSDHLLKREHPTLLAFVGSYAGFGPLPGLTVYSATKGFVAFLAESLAFEVYDSNLDITCYTPMVIESNMTKDF